MEQSTLPDRTTQISDAYRANYMKILYQRPAGSASPDRDPFGVNIN